MPRGYELDKYYDSLRAINRTMFSKQIKMLSGSLDKLGFRHADSYRLIISSLNNGLYDNLGDLYLKTHFGNNPKKFIGSNKSSYEQDFMSPMELRMCAMAVRRAYKKIQTLQNGCSLKVVQDICYSAGQEVASEISYLIQGKDEFSMKIADPILSTKPIIKKYDHALIMGTLPKSKKFTYESQEQKQEKKDLIFKNNRLFAEIKDILIARGAASSEDRARVFASFNAGYYETDMAKSHILEITKIILTDKQEDYISSEELKINIHKLECMKSSILRMKDNNFYNILKAMENAGTNARYLVLNKYHTLPELYSGFYNTYIDADKKFALKKVVKSEYDKQRNTESKKE